VIDPIVSTFNEYFARCNSLGRGGGAVEVEVIDPDAVASDGASYAVNFLSQTRVCSIKSLLKSNKNINRILACTKPNFY